MLNKQLRIGMVLGLSTLAVLALLLCMRSQSVHAQPPLSDTLASYAPAEMAVAQLSISSSVEVN